MAHNPYLQIIVLTTAALSVLSACTSEHSIAGEEPAPMSLPMTFSASEATSRALTNNDNLSSKPFSVWGYYNSPDETSSPTTIFQNTKVSFSNNRWTYNDIQYWIPGLDYTFIAMHPYEASAMTTYTNGELAIASYKANNADPSSRHDLLTASSFRECRAGSPMGPVTLKFYHILTLIDFEGILDPSLPDGTTVTITDARIYGTYDTGAWTCSPPSEANTASLGKWTIPSDVTVSTRQAPMAQTTGITLTKGTSSKLFSGDNTLLMIPQAIPQTSVFEITYHYNSDSKTTHTYQTNLANISTALRNGWEANRSYRYKFSIGPADYIIFDKPMINDWIDAEGGNHIIQDQN